MTESYKRPPDFTLTRSIQWVSSWPKLVRNPERHQLFSYLESRFGIPESVFGDYLMFKRKQSWVLMKNSEQMASASQLKISKVGMKAFQKIGAFIKPGTRMIQNFGHTATKARLEINEEQLLRLLAGYDIPVDLELDDGYVILELRKGRILGLGLLINSRVKSQLPRKELRETMVRGLSIDNR
jgi:NOL1/NOP2/fmu family ribosome biogenesis protein